MVILNRPTSVWIKHRFRITIVISTINFNLRSCRYLWQVTMKKRMDRINVYTYDYWCSYSACYNNCTLRLDQIYFFSTYFALLLCSKDAPIMLIFCFFHLFCFFSPPILLFSTQFASFFTYFAFCFSSCLINNSTMFK